MKVNWLVEDNETLVEVAPLNENYKFLNLFIKNESIIGFYVPDDSNLFKEQIINVILLNGISYTLELTKELKEELDKLL